MPRKSSPATIVTRTTHILRTGAADMTSHGGFVWPESGHVAAPDWRADAECGHGLHGFLEGEGDGSLADWSDDAKWLVARIEQHIDLGGKVKAPEAWVEFCGTRDEATQHLLSLGYRGAIVGCVLRGGYGSTMTGGVGSTMTGGVGSTMTGGVGSTMTGGVGSTMTGGYGSTMTGGYGSTMTGGVGSTMTGGVGSTMTGGVGSTMTGGLGSTMTGGLGSTMTLSYWDGQRRRVVTLYPGEDGIEAGVAYRLDDAGKPVAVPAAQRTDAM